MNTEKTHSSRDAFSLRHNYGPALAFPVVLLCLLPLWIWGAMASGDWSIIKFMVPLLLIFSAVIAWIQLGYRIWWNDKTIFQRASNGAITAINTDEIKALRQESSDIQTLFAMRRPARRITIYANTQDGSKVIDVSLKHFNLQDVRRLMQIIHEQRPDLDMPKGWS